LFFVAALFTALIPAQSKDVARAVAGAKTAQSASFGVETGSDACAALTPEECCRERLSIASFSAIGDYLPRRVKGTLRLTCMNERKVVTRQMCKSILMMRGLPAASAEAACKPGKAKKACRTDEACKQCVQDLGKLDYKGAHNACVAVTHMPRSGPTVVRVGDTRGGDSDTRFVIKKRRRLR
jgi:hypothetical protein